jgi:GTP-binding protein
VADLSAIGDRALVARGGRGGKGNARFLSNRRRAPAFAEQAEMGDEHWLDLELKLVADVALVGFPNAGKSTFISTVSAARPKIADYPFTTLEPHLGVVVTGRSGYETEFVIADVPGLVEGAAEGRGLGHLFLRHVERARVLLFLLDLGPESPSAEEQERILLGELGRYRPELLDRPRIICGSKGDIADEEEKAKNIAKMPVISAVTGSGIEDLKGRLTQLVIEAREQEAETGTDAVGRPSIDAQTSGPEHSAFVHRPLGESPLEINRGPDGTYVVTGRSVLRAVSLSDLTDDDALDLVQSRLKRLGVERALVRAGVRDGDQVQVGQLSFTYHPDDLQPDSAQTAERGRNPNRKKAKDRRTERDARRP